MDGLSLGTRDGEKQGRLEEPQDLPMISINMDGGRKRLRVPSAFLFLVIEPSFGVAERYVVGGKEFRVAANANLECGHDPAP